MAIEDKDLMRVHFRGTYTAANPSGVRGAKIVKPFDVKVKMHRRFLAADGLRGAFATYYTQSIKTRFPDMIDLYRFEMIEATAVDGSKINNVKCMSHADTIAYIKDKEYPINIGLYDSQDLRHQVGLYERDKDGQQKGQNNIMHARGGAMAIAEEIQGMNDLFEIMDPDEDHHDVAIAQQNATNRKNGAGTLHKTKAMPEVKNPAREAREAAKSEEESFGELFGDKQPAEIS